MASLVTDSLGQPKPQYENAGGTAFEAWKGAAGHGNVRSDDGQIVSIGSKNDVMVDDPELNASAIALLKGILSKTGGGAGGGVSNNGATTNNAFSGSVSAGGVSSAIDITNFRMVTIIGWTSTNTTIKIQQGLSTSSMYTTHRQTVVANPDSPGYYEFYFHLETSFNLIRLISSAAGSFYFTIAAKS